MRKVIVLVAAALCSMACPFTARAQEVYGALDLPQLGQTLTMSAAIRAQAKRDAARLKARGGRHHISTATVSGSTRFRQSPSVRKKNLDAFLAKTRATNPQGADALQKAFGRGNPFTAIAPALKRYGLRTDDAADGVTVYLVTAWYGIRGRTDDPPVAHVRGLREQVRTALLATPAFKSAPDATKQQIAESSLVLAMINEGLVDGSKDNPAQMAQVQNAIQQGVLNSFKLDLSKMTLTNQGLRRL